MHAMSYLRKSVGIFCVLLSCATGALAQVVEDIEEVDYLLGVDPPVGPNVTIDVNLTTVGESDWRDWGTGTWSADTLEGIKKDGGTGISILTKYGTAEKVSEDNRVATSWSDGTVTYDAPTHARKANAIECTADTTGIFTRRQEFTVSANAGTLYVYAVGYYSRAQLTVAQTGGPTKTITAGSAGDAVTWGVIWKVVYSGGPLTVSLRFDPDPPQTPTTSHPSQWSTVGIKAAALAPPPAPPTTPSIASGTITEPLSTTFGTESDPVSVNVTGEDLGANILASAPTGLEVSIDDITYGDTAELVPSSGSVNATLYVRLKATAAAGAYNSLNVVLTSTGATPVNVPTTGSGNLVSSAALTITADNRNKTENTTLTGGSGYTHFSVGGGQLQNGNTVTSVDVAYTNGEEAADPVAVYPNAIVISDAVGGNGFLTGNYNITYNSGTLTVIEDTLSIAQVDYLLGVDPPVGPDDTIDVNLTTVGTSDWRDWGTGIWSANTLVGIKKVGDTKISDLTKTVAAEKVTELENRIATSWSDGTVAYDEATHALKANAIERTSDPTDIFERRQEFSVSANAGTLYIYGVGYWSRAQLTVVQTGGPTKTITAGSADDAETWGVVWKVDFSGGPLTVSLRFDPDGSTSHPNQYSTVGIKAAALLKATPTATLAVNNSPVTYDGTEQAASVIISASSVAGTVSNIKYDGLSTVPTDAGTYAVTANFVPNDAVAYATLTDLSAGNFVINQAALTITAENKSKSVDGNPYSPFTVAYDGFVGGDTPANLGGTLTFGGAATTATAAGTYTAGIVPSGLTSANYDITFVPGTLTIYPLDSQTVIRFK